MFDYRALCKIQVSVSVDFFRVVQFLTEIKLVFKAFISSFEVDGSGDDGLLFNVKTNLDGPNEHY